MISTVEKLSRLETKIEKRKAAIAEETKKLNADLAEYESSACWLLPTNSS